jgi:hypothetical protein
LSGLVAGGFTKFVKERRSRKKQKVAPLESRLKKKTETTPRQNKTE